MTITKVVKTVTKVENRVTNIKVDITIKWYFMQGRTGYITDNRLIYIVDGVRSFYINLDYENCYKVGKEIDYILSVINEKLGTKYNVISTRVISYD